MPRSSSRPYLLRRFIRARRGATAVEFALVALPFMTLLFGILELAMVFIVSTTVEQATEVAARRIRTGEFQTTTGSNAGTFRDSVCERMSWLQSGCSGKLSVYVRTFTDFNSLANDPVVFNPNVTTFVPGGPTDIVLVRTSYEWTVFTPLLNQALADMGDGKRRIVATATFRNEPYQ